ncbi:SubName: Full=Uncharacterized protein {ECO:0000313/EMBL:CCA69228.1} [Serendipita indica DSM 11827]|uniref:Uncharacterized protein n=1 Tax=Serendipita indica (strain DSM 11827) TaxID=1109443 RepID=G4TD32_SERID|nr:SubName: Full=Uncharacterized protein {ECO:0000313/EMBL:CCA69228.1} [Serendipita indica DSM 11827]CCA69228.1 hypothetical protein PIIN_03128 [Serendipita indica DSM 11827]
MATVPPAKRSRESDDEDIDANDQLVDPALVSADAQKRKRGRPASTGKKPDGADAPAPATDSVPVDPAAPVSGDAPAPPIKTPEELAAEEAKKNRPPAKRGRPRKKPKTDEEAPVIAPTLEAQPAPVA